MDQIKQTVRINLPPREKDLNHQVSMQARSIIKTQDQLRKEREEYLNQQRLEGLVLNDEVLTPFLIRPNTNIKEKLDRLNEQIAGVGGIEGKNAYESEKGLLKTLRETQKELESQLVPSQKYRELSLNVFKVGKEFKFSLERGNVNLLLPRFSLYQLYSKRNEGVNDFRIVFINNPHTFRTFLSGILIYDVIDHIADLPSLVKDNLIESTGLYEYVGHTEESIDKFKNFSPDYRKALKYILKENISLSEKFSGLIPVNTKKKIAEATQCFDPALLYFFKPNTFSNNNERTDALVIGFAGRRCYIVDEFRTQEPESVK